MQGNVPVCFDILKAVTHICVQYSKGVSMRVSISLGAFTALLSLHMEWVDKLPCIPHSLGNLKFLLHVQMEYCTELRIIEALPQCLEHLDRQGCYSLIEIPWCSCSCSSPYAWCSCFLLHNPTEWQRLHLLTLLDTLKFFSVFVAWTDLSFPYQVLIAILHPGTWNARQWYRIEEHIHRICVLK